MSSQPQAAGELVTALFQAVEHGQHRLASVPGLLKQVIREDAWRQYALPHSSVVHQYERFGEFVEDWLHISVDDLKAICAGRSDYEALDLLDQVTTAPQHIHRQPDNNNVMVNNTPVQGNANTYALRKLRKDRPDLHAKVLAGGLSPHRAMVEAGYRPKQITIVLDPARTARAIQRHFSQEQQHELVELLQGSSS